MNRIRVFLEIIEMIENFEMVGIGEMLEILGIEGN